MQGDSLADKVKAQMNLEDQDHGDGKNTSETGSNGLQNRGNLTPSNDDRESTVNGTIRDHNEEDIDDQPPSERDSAAALILQRNYRGHQVRKKMNGVQLDKDHRWDELMKETNHKTDEKSALANKNDPKSRWRRGVNAATRLQKGDGLYGPSKDSHSTDQPGGPSVEASASAPKDDEEQGDDTSLAHDPEALSKRRRHKRATLLGVLSMGIGKGDGGRGETEPLPYTSKGLEEQHWLEMLDGKHRYGSNMKFYFRAWKDADTNDNFFRWLDRGEGKHLNLAELPRAQLEKERITYLSAEQRLNYLVRIGNDGFLRWAHNGERVDTTPGKWKDTGDGTGVIPIDAEGDVDPHENNGNNSDSSSSSSSSSASSLSSSALQEEAGTHYANAEGQTWLQRKKAHFTPAGLTQDLLRKTVRKDTWIYVCDMKFNLFVGMKTSGSFQHSSFLAGGKVTSAGLIVVKNGLIKNISPLSGHYRSSIEHYKSFIARLEEMGADLSHVKVGKSVAVLWGLSKYGRATKAKKAITHDLKQKLHITHDKSEKEKSDDLRKRAEEQREKERNDSSLMQTFRKNVLYGRQSSDQSNGKEETSSPNPPAETEQQPTTSHQVSAAASAA